MVKTKKDDNMDEQDGANQETYYKVKVPCDETIRLREAEPGMVLTQEVCNDNGQLLYPAKTTLTKSHLRRLKNFNKRSVTVRDYETKWIDERKYSELPDSVDPIQKKQMPPEELSNEENKENFTSAVDFVNETGSLPKLRQFANSLVEQSEGPGNDDLEEELRQLRDQTLDVEDDLEYLLAQLSKIDDDTMQQTILNELYDLVDDQSDLTDDAILSDSMQTVLQRFNDGKKEIKHKLQDLLHETPEIMQDLNEQEIPANPVESKKSGGSRNVNEDNSETSSGNGNTAEFLIEKVLQSMNESSSDELLSSLLEILDLDDFDSLDISEFLNQSDEGSARKIIDDIDLDQSEIKAIEKKLDSSDSQNVDYQDLLEAFQSMEVGEWEKGISEFGQFLEETTDANDPHHQFQEYRNQSTQLLDQWGDILGKLDEQYPQATDGREFSALFDLSAINLADELSGQEITDQNEQNLQEVVNDRETLVHEFWDDLKEILPDLLKDADQVTREKILEIFQQKSEKLKMEQLKNQLDDSLYEAEIPEGKTVEKQDMILKEAVEEKDWSSIKKLNKLPNSVLEKVKEHYRKPSAPSKWQRKLFTKYEKVFEHLVYGLATNRKAVDSYLHQVKQVLDKQTRKFSLFLQPPSTQHYHLTHAYNACLLGLILARELDLPDKALETILFATTLADVGLTMIPDTFYLEEGELSRRGEQEILKHPIYSQKVASLVFGNSHTVTTLVGEHHERLDGSGYPEAKTENELSPLSSIIGFADVYTAMIEERKYRGKRMPDEVLHHFEDKYVKFNQKLVRVLGRVLGYYPNATLVKLSDGKLAFVKEQSPEEPESPKVYVLTDENRNRLDNPDKLDLSETKSISVDLVLRTNVSV